MRPTTTAGLVAGGLVCAVALSACGGTGSGASDDAQAVTVYSADGLADWYEPVFKDFTAKTGIKVDYVEAGSGEVTSRVQKEKGNPQADLLVTLPPFIQQAKGDGDLEANAFATTGIPADTRDAEGTWAPMVDNTLAMIHHRGDPAPEKWSDLLDPKYKQKLQYSTPGQSGDGTAMMVLVNHLMGRDKGLEYFGRLQDNNVGPSSSTGKLGPKVSKGELLVANSDLQMASLAIQNDGVDYDIAFPADDKGEKVTVSVPYDIGLVKGAPHKDNGTKLAEYLLGTEVQSQIPAKAMGLPTRTDVTPTGREYETLTAHLKGVTVWRPDWDSVRDGLQSDIEEYGKVTSK